jgi:DNA-dependent RNA polymerase auxiliary subunit epsilon
MTQRTQQKSTKTAKKETTQVGAYVDVKLADDARRVLEAEGVTMTQYIIECLQAKAKDVDKVSHFESEAKFSLRDDVPSRQTLIDMRNRGELDGYFEKRGNRVLYDVNRTLAFFAGRNSSRQTAQTEATAQ